MREGRGELVGGGCGGVEGWRGRGGGGGGGCEGGRGRVGGRRVWRGGRMEGEGREGGKGKEEEEGEYEDVEVRKEEGGGEGRVGRRWWLCGREGESWWEEVEIKGENERVVVKEGV